MNKQDQFKLTQTIYKRDNLLAHLKEYSDDLDADEICEILDDIKKLNKIINRLKENEYE